jgi:hypothetical protein
MRSLLIALLSGVLVASPAFASEKKKGAGKKKAETGAACKAPAVGTCAACSITCRPGETATCAPGTTAGDVCHIQPACRCSK